jgi:hypothetical protein
MISMLQSPHEKTHNIHVVPQVHSTSTLGSTQPQFLSTFVSMLDLLQNKNPEESQAINGCWQRILKQVQLAKFYLYPSNTVGFVPSLVTSNAIRDRIALLHSQMNWSLYIGTSIYQEYIVGDNLDLCLLSLICAFVPLSHHR